MRSGGATFVFVVAVSRSAAAQEPAMTPPAVPAAETPGPVDTGADDPTVSAPPLGSPASGRVRAKAGVVSGNPPLVLTRRAAFTVARYEKAKSITLRAPAGMLVKYRLARGATVPSDLEVGRSVVVETVVVRKRRYASRVTYAESRIVLTNVE